MKWNETGGKALNYSVHTIVSVTFYKEQDQNENTETVNQRKATRLKDSKFNSLIKHH